MKLINFTDNDWFGFAGAEHFEDGSEPMIYYMKDEKVIVLDKNGLCIGYGDTHWYQLECTKALGILISIILSDETTEEQLIELGFEDIM